MYMLFSASGKLIVVLSTHVDDCFCAGQGDAFEAAVKTLRAEFPFGQWISPRGHTLRYCGSESKENSGHSVEVS